MKTPTPLQQAKAELRELRADMKRKGIRKISAFNGGLSRDEYSMNTERFRLETIIQNLAKQP